MPLYEYKCETCGKTFEKLQSIAEMEDQHQLYHLHCGGGIELQYSKSSLKFVGSGFYVNDYKK